MCMHKPLYENLELHFSLVVLVVGTVVGTLSYANVHAKQHLVWIPSHPVIFIFYGRSMMQKMSFDITNL